MRNLLGYALTATYSYIATTLLLGCGSEPPEDIQHKTVTSDLTVDGADAQAAPSSLKNLPLEEAREVIRDYWQERFANQNGVVATTRTSDGSVFDWFVAEPDEPVPPPSPPTAPLPENAVYARSVLEAEPEARGPENTFPNMRPNVEALLKEWGDSVPDEPDRLLDILTPPSVPADGYYHAGYYMRSNSSASNDLLGQYARLTLWYSAPIAPGDHTIMQILMQAGLPTGNQLDTIEAGKRQTSALIPYLFMYFTNSFYTSTIDPGFCTGDYVNPVPGDPTKSDLPHGWHTVTNTVWPPNIPFANNLTRDPNCAGSNDVCKLSWIDNSGNQHNVILGLQWLIDSSNRWWLYVNNVAVGYFAPTCTVSGVAKTMFHTSTLGRGLASSGNRADFYAEVFDSAHPSATNTRMGNGRYPASLMPPSGAGLQAAWMDQLEVYHSSLGWQFYNGWAATKKGTSAYEDPACYSMSSITASSGFYVGGAGTDQGAGCH